MPINDLREFIDKTRELGQLKVLKGVDWDLEMGAIAHLSQRIDDFVPLIVFEDIKNARTGSRVLINALSSPERLQLVAGCQEKAPGKLAMVEQWLQIMRAKRLIPPQFVQEGPVLENVHEGKDVDLLEFPVPRWHELDGGRYIGTGSVTITSDPEQSWVNLGTYRVMLHDEQTVGFYVSPGGHSRLHRDKYFEKGLPCPVAISLGQDPLLFLASTMGFPTGFPEYDWAGGVRGEAVRVVKAPFTGLPIPADAEIVIEGEAIPGETKDEGPFGEWTGYYASAMRPEAFIRIKTVMHRNNPILCGSPPGKPPWDASLQQAVVKSALLWDALEVAGVPEVRGVYRPEASGANTIIIISIKQRHPGHARQAALAAAGCRAGAYMGRYIIVVDDDIDPTNINEVLWALASRSDPERSIDILRECLSSDLDPIIPKGQKGLNSKAIIEACRPFAWLKDFPPVAEPSKELEKWVREKWQGELF